MAERSKAPDSSSGLFGGAGSNPAPVRFCLAHRDVQRGCSSNGRALAQHARGTGIDTLHLHFCHGHLAQWQSTGPVNLGSRVRSSQWPLCRARKSVLVIGGLAQWQSIGLVNQGSGVRSSQSPEHFLQKGSAGNRTLDLSHPKRESCH